MTTGASGAYSFEMENDGLCVVAVFKGEISTHRYSEFRNDYNEICRRVTESETKLLIIDLSETLYFGSLFIGMIVKLTISAGNQGGKVALCGLSDQLKDLMKKLLLLERSPNPKVNLSHYATRELAVAALTSELTS